MSKRKIKLTDEDLSHGNDPKKMVKRRQTKNLKENVLDPPSKSKQSQLTNFFLSKHDKKPEPMEEEKQPPRLPSSKNKKDVTLEISDNESETSYYSDRQEKAAPVRQASPPKAAPRRTLRDMPNVVFYMNLSASRPQGDLIEKIHKCWKGDYKKLEIHHGFVQWLFPNHYGSAFNKDAHALSADEAMIFRSNKEIAERLVTSYEMMLDFYGMRMTDKKTGKLERANNYQIRYRLALLTNLHNHLRIKRILAHLSIVGFRVYAIELVNFLEVEIYGEKGGHKKYLEQSKPLKLDYIKTINENPLYGLVKHDIFKDWSIFGETTNQKELNVLMLNAMISDEKELEPSVLLKSK